MKSHSSSYCVMFLWCFWWGCTGNLTLITLWNTTSIASSTNEVWSIDWLIDWLMDGRMDWLTDWLINKYLFFTSASLIRPLFKASRNPIFPLRNPLSSVKVLQAFVSGSPSVKFRCSPIGILFSSARAIASVTLEPFTKKETLETTPDTKDSTMPLFLSSE